MRNPGNSSTFESMTSISIGAFAALAAIVVAAAVLTIAPHGPRPLRNWPSRRSFRAANATSVLEAVGSSSRSARNTRGKALTLQGSFVEARRSPFRAVEFWRNRAPGPTSLRGGLRCGWGVCHPFWSANAVLIQVNVGMLPLC
jgi:hypothetical protein